MLSLDGNENDKEAVFKTGGGSIEVLHSLGNSAVPYA